MMKPDRRRYLKATIGFLFAQNSAAEVADVFSQPPIGTGASCTKFFSDNGEAVRNSGMGWILYYYANSLSYYSKEIDQQSDESLLEFPGATVIYFRLAWSYLESQEGHYNWDLIDIPAQRFIKLGFRIAIRVTSSEIDAGQPFATPEWVFTAGAKSVRFRPGHPGARDEIGGRNTEPVFSDPIFLRKLDNFLCAFAARYDGDDAVEFIDVGSFGVYGEGHTISSTQSPYPAQTVITHMKLYDMHFKRTRLIANHNFADHDISPARDYSVVRLAAEMGMGLRDDSIMVAGGKRAYYDDGMAKSFYDRAPVVLETSEYSTRVTQGLWNPEVMLNAISAYRASYVGAYWHPAGYLANNRSLIDKVNLILGYRVLFKEVKWIIKTDDVHRIAIEYTIKNVSVAPPLFYIYVEFSIFTKDGVSVFTFSDTALKLSSCKDPFCSITRSMESEIPTLQLRSVYRLCCKVISKSTNRVIYLAHNERGSDGLLTIGEMLVT